MADPTEKKDLESFLANVDQLESIMKGLASKDTDAQQKSMDMADRFLHDMETVETKKTETPAPDRTGFNKTVINQKAFDDSPSTGPEFKPGMSQDSFMVEMERDAAERAERRAKSEKEAKELKERGNDQFRAGCYEAALELYTQALSKVRDNTVLYTNRAQTYIRLGRYEEALKDCDWAIRIHENCLKAYVHQGKARLGLGQYAEAKQSYQRAAKIDPKKEGIIKEYISEVEHAEQTSQQEKLAQEAFAAGDSTSCDISQVMERINKEKQLPLFYSGGMRVLTDLLKTETDRTVFRTSGGFDYVDQHSVIAPIFGASPKSLSAERMDSVTAMFSLLTAAVKDLEESQRAALERPVLPGQCLCYLRHSAAAPRLAALSFLHTVSETGRGRASLVEKMDVPSLLETLFKLARLKGVIAVNSAGLLNNLALDKKFKGSLKNSLDTSIIPAFENLLKEGVHEASVLPCCVSFMSNLANDASIRQQMVARVKLWEACCMLLEQPATGEELQHTTLGLLMNLTISQSAPLESQARRLLHLSRPLLTCGLEGVETRALGLMSHVLPHSVAATELACSHKMHQVFFMNLESNSDERRRSAMKCVTACTQQSPEARQDVFNLDPAMVRLQGLLKSTSEVVVGNAALTLCQLVGVAGVSVRLLDTPIMQELLVLARDSSKQQVRKNCAVLIAKLAETHERHLQRLRELDGMGILHSCMKFFKSYE